MRILLLSLVASLLSTSVWANKNCEKFVLRCDPEFEKAPWIETPALTDAVKKGNAIVVDVRSDTEFNIINVAGCVQIQVGKMTEKDLANLRGKEDAKIMAFYCNGTSCKKSYKATLKAMEWGYKNVFVYDDGIFEWALANPEMTNFFGEKLTKENVKQKLISREAFKAKCIPPTEFIEKMKSGKYTVIDIRDPNERKEDPITVPGIKQMDFDIIAKTIALANSPVPKAEVLFFDNVGKQVDWLQYYLDKNGVKNYYFLDGGVRRWQKEGFKPDGTK